MVEPHDERDRQFSVTSARRVLFVFISALSLLAVAAIIWRTVGGDQRRPVSVIEVEVVDVDTLQLVVDSCNGSPTVESIRRVGDSVEVRVVASFTPFRADNDCLDSLEVEIADPFDVNRLVDLDSGSTFRLGHSLDVT
ncbi:MAG: hypothetical protein R8J94_14870 [Acidimicrobiia bacterium]|nr:hypothetical protein [Acidimicrobiia bacterium]